MPTASLPWRDWRDWFLGRPRRPNAHTADVLLPQVRAHETQAHSLSDPALTAAAHDLRRRARAGEQLDDLLPEAFALACVAARRTLHLDLFDEQIVGAIALHQGHIAEMQTGEGKTLVATLPAFLNSLTGDGVHILTVNDYLARRDAQWMAPLYDLLGVSVEPLLQGMSIAERQRAYRADVTYATANEVGFDVLRDQMCRTPHELVQRAFHYALIDEADSILIDEARIPLVIAGGAETPSDLAPRMAELARTLRAGRDFAFDDYSRNVQLTAGGVERAERVLDCGNLYAPENLATLTAINFALHAEALLHRDVDYLVQDQTIVLVDELKGRVAQGRRWPAGLQAAVEAKENLPPRREGRVLASLTLQALAMLYPKLAGMTGTAATQAEEFRAIYELEVVVIPTHRPVIRRDQPDVVFASRRVKERELVRAIDTVHATGRPILIGTGSVEESERLSGQLTEAGIPHNVLNARTELESAAREAAIVAQAGAPGTVTLSTNMAGRGTDILLGGNPPQDRDAVVTLGGLYVIGTNRHESRRIDHQLRGRAGRQGDPGSSRFFLSLEDDLLERYGVARLLPWHFRRRHKLERIDDPAVTAEIERVQRIIENEMLQARRTLWKYDGVLERQRRVLHARRMGVLQGESGGVLAAGTDPDLIDKVWKVREAFGEPLLAQVERDITLAVLDDHWAGYLNEMDEVRDGVPFLSYSGQDPFRAFQRTAIDRFDTLLQEIDAEVRSRFLAAEVTADGIDPRQAGLYQPGATWTYHVTDQIFGDLQERITRNVRRVLLQRS